MSQQIESALARIEASQVEMRETQRDMKEAINKLVAVEVKQQEDRETMKRFGDRQEEHAKRIHSLEIKQAEQNWLYTIGKGAITKVVMWLVGVLTVLGSVGYMVSQ